MNLRDTSYRIRILDSELARGTDKPASFKQSADELCALHLALMRSGLVETGAESIGNPSQRFNGHGCRSISGYCQHYSIIERDSTHCSHSLCAVYKAYPFFGHECKRRYSGS